jgi:hypothetical protein
VFANISYWLLGAGRWTQLGAGCCVRCAGAGARCPWHWPLLLLPLAPTLVCQICQIFAKCAKGEFCHGAYGLGKTGRNPYAHRRIRGGFSLLALGNRGQVKRRVQAARGTHAHARNATCAPPPAPRALPPPSPPSLPFLPPPPPLPPQGIRANHPFTSSDNAFFFTSVSWVAPDVGGRPLDSVKAKAGGEKWTLYVHRTEPRTQ